MHGHLGGVPPVVDLGAERALAQMLHAAVGLVTSAHDLSDGGLAQALVESSLRHMCGVTVSLGSVVEDPFVALFSESAARCLVTVPHDDVDALIELAAEHGVPVTELGTTGGDLLTVSGGEDSGLAFDVNLLELRSTWMKTLPLALA